MEARLLHIFRNTPLGRETLMQSLYFCQKTETNLNIYIPEFIKFLMYFENDVVQVDLDESYLTAPKTARSHALDLAYNAGLKPNFLEPKNFTASTLPDIPTNFDFMCCPRTISDLSSKVGLGYLGPRVRRIVKSAMFPVLITSPVHKPWTSIAVFFGGSNNAVNALKLGLRLGRVSGMPVKIFTQLGNKPKAHYEKIIEERGLQNQIEEQDVFWQVFEEGKFEENLYEVPHDALCVVGAFGHSLVKDIMFGSTMEKIQSVISNNLLIVGPKYAAVH